ncbi:MAG: T9SS type A sorting domain-containing protein [Bacteroidota bacterium]
MECYNPYIVDKEGVREFLFRSEISTSAGSLGVPIVQIGIGAAGWVTLKWQPIADATSYRVRYINMYSGEHMTLDTNNKEFQIQKNSGEGYIFLVSSIKAPAVSSSQKSVEFIIIDEKPIVRDTQRYSSLGNCVCDYPTLNKPRHGEAVEEVTSPLEAGLSEVRLFPNPSQSSFTLSYQLSQSQTVGIWLSDVLGRQVKMIQLDQLQNEGLQQFEVLIDDLPSGHYQLWISTEQSTKSFPVLKQ